jgi:cobyrinic acid a,c-diamide synthase
VDFAAPGPAEAVQPWLAGRTVAVARDAAFSFIYPPTWTACVPWGAIAFFSPLAGDALPPCDAMWLPGGYPELHLARWPPTPRCATALPPIWRRAPVWAECGGMLALCDGVTALRQHPAVGPAARPGACSRPGGLGMQQLATPWGLLRGHTFHYTGWRRHAGATRSSRPAQAQPDRGEALYRMAACTPATFHAWFPPARARGGAFGATIAGQAMTDHELHLFACAQPAHSGRPEKRQIPPCRAAGAPVAAMAPGPQAALVATGQAWDAKCASALRATSATAPSACPAWPP